MRIRKRLAALSAGLAAHPRVQARLDAPQPSQSARPPTTGCTPPKTAAANPNLRGRELQVIQEGSRKFSSHVYKQQVSQTHHPQADSRVSHDHTQLAVSRSKPPPMDACAAAGLELTSHGAYPHGHAEGTVPILPRSKQTVDAAFLAHECKMASYADPDKAAGLQYSDNVSWWHGRPSLEVADQELQTSTGASLAYAPPGSANAHECKEDDSRGKESANHCRRRKAVTITKHFLSADAQLPASLPSSSAAHTNQVNTLSTPPGPTKPQRSRNPISNSLSLTEDPLKGAAKHMSINGEYSASWVRDNGDLQRLARDLIRNNVNANGVELAPGCNENKGLLLEEASAHPKQRDARTDGGIEAGNDSGEEERCCRRSGQGWRCKNMRSPDRSSIYCDYHQLKIHQNHASWNARNKTLKENKRKREFIEPHASIQPLQNKMVDVKMFELPLLPSKQHMYKNVQAHEAISSEVGAIFKRMFQAAAGMEKQQLSNMGTYRNSTTHENITVLPSLAESMVLPTQDAQENSESQAGLGTLKFKGRRIEKAEEVPECNLDGDEENSDGGLLPDKIGHGAILVHEMDGGDEHLGTYREEPDQKTVRCKRVNGKGWQCGNMNAPNSGYCQHHQTKVNRRNKKRSGGKARIGQPTPLVKATNTLAAAHSMIDPRCSVQATKEYHDAGYLERELNGISMGDEYGTQDETYENGYQEEKQAWAQHARESREIKKQRQVQHEGLQDGILMECGMCDTGGHNRLHVKQLQEEQLRWWEYKQGGSDSTFTSQKAGITGNQAKALLLPRRSERRLIIDVCRSTAAEHQQIECKMVDHGCPPLKCNHPPAAGNSDELLQFCTSSDSAMGLKLQSGEIEPANGKIAQKMQGSEQRQCKRHDGRGWRCKRVCRQGQFYCEHHLTVMRNYVERTDAKCKGRLQQQRVVAALHAQEVSPRLDEKSSIGNELELQAVTTEKLGHMQQVCEKSCGGAGNGLGRIARDMAKPGSNAAKEQMKQLQRAGQQIKLISHSSELQQHKKRAGHSQGQFSESNELVYNLEQLVAGMDQPPGLPKQRRVQPAASQSLYEVHERQGVAGSADQPAVAGQELNIAKGEKNGKSEQVTKQEPVQEGQRRCGRHDGRGWRCKSMCKEGSLYCEYHREKLRRNHASWNAKKLQEKKAHNSNMQAAVYQREEAADDADEEDQRRMATLTVRAMQKKAQLVKKMRSLHDIEARSI